MLWLSELEVVVFQIGRRMWSAIAVYKSNACVGCCNTQVDGGCIAF